MFLDKPKCMMSESIGGYSLRRGVNSPYRNKTTASPVLRKKKKVIPDEQELNDSVHVATYNDNPKHLYGMPIFCLLIVLNTSP